MREWQRKQDERVAAGIAQYGPAFRTMESMYKHISTNMFMTHSTEDTLVHALRDMTSKHPEVCLLVQGPRGSGKASSTIHFVTDGGETTVEGMTGYSNSVCGVWYQKGWTTIVGEIMKRQRPFIPSDTDGAEAAYANVLQDRQMKGLTLEICQSFAKALVDPTRDLLEYESRQFVGGGGMSASDMQWMTFSKATRIQKHLQSVVTATSRSQSVTQLVCIVDDIRTPRYSSERLDETDMTWFGWDVINAVTKEVCIRAMTLFSSFFAAAGYVKPRVCMVFCDRHRCIHTPEVEAMSATYREETGRPRIQEYLIPWCPAVLPDTLTSLQHVPLQVKPFKDTERLEGDPMAAERLNRLLYGLHQWAESFVGNAAGIRRVRAREYLMSQGMAVEVDMEGLGERPGRFYHSMPGLQPLPVVAASVILSTASYTDIRTAATELLCSHNDDGTIVETGRKTRISRNTFLCYLLWAIAKARWGGITDTPLNMPAQPSRMGDAWWENVVSEVCGSYLVPYVLEDQPWGSVTIGSVAEFMRGVHFECYLSAKGQWVEYASDGTESPSHTIHPMSARDVGSRETCPNAVNMGVIMAQHSIQRGGHPPYLYMSDGVNPKILIDVFPCYPGITRQETKDTVLKILVLTRKSDGPLPPCEEEDGVVLLLHVDTEPYSPPPWEEEDRLMAQAMAERGPTTGLCGTGVTQPRESMDID
ncbi:hypothetical protein KIPB_007344 [Kipferlia bialata]|uniref:Uncharacterized protein n=1 Tax=Kipferlia bialata TaxID=797122 RepID=A0A9K3CZZ3_9EUKA|nr:hypothetical protein KIPB_007344 [Kipferlia bialata]|eukprot:g7344.t1